MALIDQQRLGVGVFQADGDAFGGYVGVEGQPGGAGLGDAQLQRQQLDAARQPQAHHVAGAHAGLDQPVRHQVGGGVELGVGQVALAGHQRRLAGQAGRGGLEDVGQDLVAQQVGPVGAVEDGRQAHGGVVRAVNPTRAGRRGG